MTPRRRLPGDLAAILVVACACIAVIAPGSHSYWRPAEFLHDFLHVPGFGLITLILWLGFSSGEGSSSRSRVPNLLALFSASITIGVGVEVLQASFGGDANAWDVGSDTVGTVCALLVLESTHRQLSAAWRWGLRLAAVAGLLLALVPSMQAIAEDRRAKREFPVLADFCTRSELHRFTWSTGSLGTFEPPRGSSAHGSLRLDLEPSMYPGLSLAYFPRDWKGWRELSIVCENRSPTPLRVTVRIDDLQHNNDYNDRFNRSVLLVPGWNDVRISLTDVESAPAGRRLDLGHIRSVILFAVDLREPRSLVLREFRLM